MFSALRQSVISGGPGDEIPQNIFSVIVPLSDVASELVVGMATVAIGNDDVIGD